MTLETAFTMNASNIKYGPGITREVGYDMEQLGCTRVMVVTDPRMAGSEPGGLRGSGWSPTQLLRESRRRTFAVPGELAKAHTWHQAIFAAIEKGNPNAAREAMAAHLEQVEQALEQDRVNREKEPG